MRHKPLRPSVSSRSRKRPGRLLPVLTAVVTMLLAGVAGPGAAADTAPGTQGAGLPPLPVNACHDTGLPTDFGTNFPVPSDPNGFGYQNQSAIGWERNIYAPFAYLSGSYFARGVPTHYTAGRTTYCGAMYSFGVYDYGLASGQKPAPGSVQWTMAEGHLPALTTSFSRSGVDVSITDFADQQVIAGSPIELVYTRITVHNTTGDAVDVPPGATGPGLRTLGDAPDTVPAGGTVRHDYVAAVSAFDTTTVLPGSDGLATASSYDSAYAHMRSYWNARLATIPKLTLPSTTIPDGSSVSGKVMEDAYQAAFVYTRVVQTQTAPFSAANNYDWLLNHDVPGLLLNRFALGDFTDARQLLLTGRISEQPGFDEKGANWYWDGLWKTPSAWAEYLQQTGDTGFVKQYFHDDAQGSGSFGPSLFTLMHTDYLSQLGPNNYLKSSFDNDSQGTWLFDDESALLGLASYRYIAGRIGETDEAAWAKSAYDSLLAATNKALAANESAGDFAYLPCEVNRPNSANRCATANDANWDGSNMWNQNVWDVYAAGGSLNGVLGDPAQTDELYRSGFARLTGTDVPFPSFGAFSGFSTAYNTSYTEAALYGDAFRDLPVTSYAWQIATSTGGPNAWWEANGSAPDPTNPWAGSHAGPQFGASPYTWPMAGQTSTLLQSLVAARRVDGGAKGWTTALDIGRGVPDSWLTDGQTVAASGLTSSYAMDTAKRATYDVRITTSGPAAAREVTVELSGAVPQGTVDVQLPSLASAGVRSVRGGTYDAGTHTAHFASGSRTLTVLLGAGARPSLTASADSTVSGTHPHPIISDGQSTTLSSTVTNTGQDMITGVSLTAQVPAGWKATPTTSTTAARLIPGQSATARWTVTPTATAVGGFQLRVLGSYQSGVNNPGSVQAESFVQAQPALPVPAGEHNAALTATASASHTSPWEHVTAINDGIFPTSSNDSQDLRWGTWPEQGEQWVELDWTQPVTADGSALYFLDDGGGVRLPASWKVQYWDGTSFADVPGASSYPVADNTFNQATFTPVTTTRLRAVLESGQGSVGLMQWVVDAPGTS